MKKVYALLFSLCLIAIGNAYAEPLLTPMPGYITDYALDGTRLGTSYYNAAGEMTSTYPVDPSKPPKAYANLYLRLADGSARLAARNYYNPDGSVGNYTLYAYTPGGVLHDATNFTFMGMYMPRPGAPLQRIDVMTRNTRYGVVAGRTQPMLIEIYTPFRDPQLIGGSGWTSRIASRTEYSYSPDGTLATSDVTTFDTSTGVPTRTTHMEYIYIGTRQLVATSSVKAYVSGQLSNEVITHVEYSAAGVVHIKEIDYIDARDPSRSYHRSEFYDELGQLTHSLKTISDGTVYTLDAGNRTMRVDYTNGSHAEYTYLYGDSKADELRRFDAQGNLEFIQTFEYDDNRIRTGSTRSVLDANHLFVESVYHFDAQNRTLKWSKFSSSGELLADLYYDWLDGVLVGRTLINYYKDAAGSPYELTRTYNAQYLVTDTVKTGREGRVLYSIHVHYDGAGVKISSEKTVNHYGEAGLKRSVRYEMDGQDRILAVDNEWGHGVYVYGAGGALERIHYDSGVIEEYSYLPDGRLGSVVIKQPGGEAVSTETFVYNTSTGKLQSSTLIRVAGPDSVEKIQSFYTSSGRVHTQKFFYNDVLAETRVYHFDSLGMQSGYTLTTPDGASVEVDASGFVIKPSIYPHDALDQIVDKQTVQQKPSDEVSENVTFTSSLSDPVKTGRNP